MPICQMIEIAKLSSAVSLTINRIYDFRIYKHIFVSRSGINNKLCSSILSFLILTKSFANDALNHQFVSQATHIDHKIISDLDW